MKRPTIEALKALLTRRGPSLRSLDLSWFGGEPLLASDIVLEITEHAKSLCYVNRQLMIHGTITTNGYLLTRSLASSLIQMGIDRFQITLDGPRETHDDSRRRADGLGTFDVVLGNLLALRELQENFRILIRLHYSPTTWECVADFVPELNDLFASDRRFSVLCHPIERLRREGNLEARDHQVMYFSSHAEEKSVERFIAAKLAPPLLQESIEGDYVCYASKANTFVLRADGTVCKCTVALNAPYNEVGLLTTEGKINIDNDLHRKWLQGLEDLNAERLACPNSFLKRSLGWAPVALQGARSRANVA